MTKYTRLKDAYYCESCDKWLDDKVAADTHLEEEHEAQWYEEQLEDMHREEFFECGDCERKYEFRDEAAQCCGG